MTKEEFFKSISEIEKDEIYLTETLDELSKEIEINHWSIGIASETAMKIENSDLQFFLRKVVDNRTMQLENSDKKMDLLYYLWFDEQAGSLNFNFINYNHEKLPFGAEIDFVESIDAIIGDFLNSKYLDGIPWNEIKDSEEYEKTEYKLKVYKEKIVKSTKAQQYA